jgi:ribosomal protein S12 methylthiotransferase
VRRDVIDRRVARITALVEEVTAQRAEDRIGTTVDVLVESVDGERAEGRAEHQAPEVDGAVSLRGAAGVKVGDTVRATVVGTEGVDLLAEAR